MKRGEALKTAEDVTTRYGVNGATLFGTDLESWKKWVGGKEGFVVWSHLMGVREAQGLGMSGRRLVGRKGVWVER